MKKLLALILSLSVMITAVPAAESKASVIYTIQGSASSDDTLVGSQWGLDNDGSFTVESGNGQSYQTPFDTNYGLGFGFSFGFGLRLLMKLTIFSCLSIST